jgi:NADH-quinone oxidoreductase subunit L
MVFQEAGATGSFFYLAQWIIFIPLIGLLVNLVFGSSLGEKWSGWLGSLASGLTFVVSVLLAISVAGQPEGLTVPIAGWMQIGTLAVNWSMRVDTLSVVMMLVVSGIGTLIHIYAIGYMHDDVRHNGDPKRFSRFFVYLNLFIAAMMVLVSADNYLMLFVGWEGVGLCSYLLIGFWFEKGKDGIGNALAAKKAFITNRVGDFGLLIALFMIFAWFGALDFQTVFAKAAEVSAAAPGAILVITLFMLLGVAGKSAQLPLYVWLPDAMAGPTPVSALIHAATMVTAGVYLVARTAPLYSLQPTAQGVVAWVGAITAIFTATIALGQYDIKKVLAYSTISQLGFMVAAVGMGAFVAGMFHLVTHAFFKALLFLSSGSVIQGMERGELRAAHAKAPKAGKGKNSSGAHGHAADAGHNAHGSEHIDPQDMRNMGGLRSRMQATFWVYLIGTLALAGIVPLAGFFSKDEILAEALHVQPGIFWVLLVAAFFTAFYMGRQVLLVFFGSARTDAAAQATESPVVMTVPLIILAVLSALGGALNLPAGLGGETLGHILTRWLEHTITSAKPGEFNLVVALGALALALLGLFAAWYFYGKRQPLGNNRVDPLARILGPVFTGMENKWWVDELYGMILLRPYRVVADFLSQPVDLGIIDGTSKALAEGVRQLSGGLRKLQTGFVRLYALAVVVGVVLIMAYLVTR